MAKQTKNTFTIQVPADQDEFLEQAAELLCNSKVGVIKLAINRLKNSGFLDEAKRLNTQPLEAAA